MSADADYTVVFHGHPRNIKGNPFDLQTDFGRVVIMSVGNVCDVADRFREALQEIVDKGGRNAEELAQAALDECNDALKAALTARSAK